MIFLTIVSSRAILFPAGTRLAEDCALAILVEDADPALPIQGVEAAVLAVVASVYAFLHSRHLVRVHKVPLALVGLPALS